MKKRALAGALVLLVVAAGVVWEGIGRGPTTPLQPAPQFTAASHRIDAGSRLSVSGRNLVARQLDVHDGFEHDLLFLLNSSLYGRCHPERAHDLGRMAVAARLPVLDAMEPLLHQDPSLRDQLYSMIRSVAAEGDCAASLQLVIGDYAATLQPARYAMFFPDSYFDPGLAAPPNEFGGRSLAERAADPCTEVGYAVLPIGGGQSWVCLGARAAMRRHLVVDLCGAGGSHAPADTPALARSIEASMQALPPACR
jgi:hypothetical protein